MVFKFPIAKWMYKRYPTTNIDKLLPRMRYEILDREIKVRGSPLWRRQLFGRQMRLKTIAKTVNDLIREERVHVSYFKGWEVRNYTERLIMEAIRYGDCHRPTMELANFYLNDKNLIHKLFKVLVPRYINYSESFTKMHLLPLPVEKTLNKWDEKTRQQDTDVLPSVVLELKGNPLPKVTNEPIKDKNLLTNVLIRAAKNEYFNEKTKKTTNQK